MPFSGFFSRSTDPAVGLAAVRVGVGCVPVELRAAADPVVTACELARVGATAHVQVFVLLLLVISADVAPSFAVGETVASQLVEYVAEFVTAYARALVGCRNVREIQHSAELHVVRVLVVGVFEVVQRFVFGVVVDAELRVFHAQQAFVRVRVVQCRDQPDRVAAGGHEATVQRYVQFLVDCRAAAQHSPVVVETGAGHAVDRRDVVVVHAMRNVFQRAHAVVEAEPVGCAARGIAEIVRVRDAVESCAVA